MVGGIFRFRISKTTQLNLFSLKFSKTKILINIGFWNWMLQKNYKQILDGQNMCILENKKIIGWEKFKSIT
jgi:hypothetical protein